MYLKKFCSSLLAFGNCFMKMHSHSSGYIESLPRMLYTFINAEDIEVINNSNHLELSQRNNNKVRINYQWLRDHCRCKECYNHSTYQRQMNLEVLRNLKSPLVTLKDQSLYLKWPDGHETQYQLKMLLNLYNNEGDQKLLNERILWNAQVIKNQDLPEMFCHQVLSNDDSLLQLLKSLITYGFGIVKEVEPTIDATKKLVERISIVQRTLFGEMWTFTTEMKHSDTAYTNIKLDPHNDTTYFSQPIGLLVFHCFYHDGEGGETILVDGFNAADCLRKLDPKSFDHLTSFHICQEYIEKGCHFKKCDTVLKVSPLTKDIEQIRFNPYDRSPMYHLSPDEVDIFYQSYLSLSDQIKQSDSQHYIKLQPGSVILIDNRRVLHGRNSFTGKRIMGGCYLPFDDYWSKVRTLWK